MIKCIVTKSIHNVSLTSRVCLIPKLFSTNRDIDRRLSLKIKNQIKLKKMKTLKIKKDKKDKIIYKYYKKLTPEQLNEARSKMNQHEKDIMDKRIKIYSSSLIIKEKFRLAKEHQKVIYLRKKNLLANLKPLSKKQKEQNLLINKQNAFKNKFNSKIFDLKPNLPSIQMKKLIAYRTQITILIQIIMRPIYNLINILNAWIYQRRLILEEEERNKDLSKSEITYPNFPDDEFENVIPADFPENHPLSLLSINNHNYWLHGSKTILLFDDLYKFVFTTSPFTIQILNIAIYNYMLKAPFMIRSNHKKDSRGFIFHCFTKGNFDPIYNIKIYLLQKKFSFRNFKIDDTFKSAFDYNINIRVKLRTIDVDWSESDRLNNHLRNLTNDVIKTITGEIQEKSDKLNLKINDLKLQLKKTNVKREIKREIIKKNIDKLKREELNFIKNKTRRENDLIKINLREIDIQNKKKREENLIRIANEDIEREFQLKKHQFFTDLTNTNSELEQLNQIKKRDLL